jgi:response regulator RpfG family c-di-GMP phosphodiesterase
MLRSQGYQLLEAHNGPTALRLAASHRGPIDLLVTEVVMPHMNGFTLGERLVESHPGTRVVLMSGKPDRSVTGRGRPKKAKQPFVDTAFARDYVLQTIREQLDKIV